MDNPVSLQTHGDIAVLHVDNPPVNALSREVIDGLRDAVDVFEKERTFRALLVHCAGSTFVAGADIAIFDRPDFTTAVMNEALQRLEDSDRIVVAVLQGTALGGGLELALACHYRVAVPNTRIGLPEVKLGILPGSLGTQRLPRLTGAAFALEAIQSGRMVGVEEACAAGAIDRVEAGAPLDVGLRYVRELLAQGNRPRRSSGQSSSRAVPPDFFVEARRRAIALENKYPAQIAIVDAVEAAVTRPYSEGEQVEAEQLRRLVRSPQSAALRHLFFAERAAAKVPGLPKDTPLRPIRSVGIVGAGTMGAGIAMTFADAGMPVVLLDQTQQGLANGLQKIRSNYESSVAKGRLALEAMQRRVAAITGTLKQQELAECDLVIEAVFEDLQLKTQVVAGLGKVCKPGAIIATNTSTLDVDVIARASGRPQDVLGLHFFSPANIMRLLEVVRGAQTAPDVLATGMQLARTIRKVPVVSGVCYGFIGNRMAEPYMREMEFLLMEGATPRQIDAAVENSAMWGMAMGPCRMLDMAGVDVGARTLIERRKLGELPDPAYRPIVLRLSELGRHGQKAGAGFYRYQGRNPLPDLEADAIFAAVAQEHGVRRRDDISDPEIVERLLYPLVNEGLKILGEGIAYRASDVDIVWTSGYGFPDHRGGPMFMADRIGARRILERLVHYGQVRSDTFDYWTPADLLREHAASGTRITPARIGA